MTKETLEKYYRHISENKMNLFEKIAADRTKHVTVILEDIFQPHNASAVIRSCDLFGIQDLHIIEERYEFSPSRRVDMGSRKWVDLHMHNTKKDNTKDCLDQLKKKGYRIVSMEPAAETTLNELDLSTPVAFMFGTELEGLSNYAKSMADEHIKIPMYGFTESFNISVSAALTLYDTTRRLRESDINWQLSEQELIELKIKWCKKLIKNGDIIEKYF